MTLTDRCMAILRAQITAVQELLEQSDIPADKAVEIAAKLDQMLDIVARYD